MNNKTKKVLNFLPALIWMLIIFYFSSQQTTGIGGESYLFRFALLKSFHIVEYAILTLLLFFVIKKNKYLFLASYIYALSDEFHQMFVPGRTGNIQDTFFDIFGIFIGLLILNFFKKRPILK